MDIFVNPGSGDIEDATEKNAIENMPHFIVDIGGDAEFVRLPNKDDGDGRFCFLVWRGNECHEVTMPGLPLSQVRYVDEKTQDIWDFPRLYVDGSSWVWMFAVDVIFKDYKNDEDDEEE